MFTRLSPDVVWTLTVSKSPDRGGIAESMQCDGCTHGVYGWVGRGQLSLLVGHSLVQMVCHLIG